MNRFTLVSLILAAVSPCFVFADTPSPELAKKFQERIRTFHQDQEPNGEKLRVIYFHPKDNPPQKDYEARAERIVRDVQEFLHAEMQRIGFDDSPPMPIETDDTRKLKLHLVTGSDDSDAYTYESGQKVKMEIIKALGDDIDFKSDFLLVLGGMCQKRGEKNYFFHAPYYGDGGSSQEWGLCYAADCEILDPLNLTEANGKVQMKFGEHNGEFPMSVARFNSWYLGGIAHEMGHGLSLPHNGQLPSELNARGNALMGGGNHTYGDERWGGGKGSFLTFASALRLAAHPLFTGSDRERFSKKEFSFDELRCEAEGERLILRGKVESTPPPLAVIAYSDPPGRSGYNARTWVGEIADDGSFTIDASEHVPGLHDLRLSVLQLNGAVGTIASTYQVDKNRHPDAAMLNARFALRPAIQAFLKGDQKGAAEFARSQIANHSDPFTRNLLAHIASLADPPAPVDLATVKADSFFLSDAIWKKAQVGWGEPARNQYFVSRHVRDGLILELGGQYFEKGLYAHASSEYVFALDGSWKSFDATVGLQAGVGQVGRSRFIVKGDGKTLFTSGILKGNETQVAKAEIAGVKELTLEVESTIEGNPQCWSVWGAPQVTR